MRVNWRRAVAQLLVIISIAYINFLSANAAETLSLNGEIRSAGHPVASAGIVLSGPYRASTQSDAKGRFHIAIPAPGAYVLEVLAPGYRPYRRRLDLEATQSINVALEPGALPVIGSVTGVARPPFNSTPLTVRVFPREAYRDQGQPDMTTVLSQTPGALIARSTSVNGAAPLAPATGLVRGGLPFETPVMLDGAPVSLPSTGTLDLALLPTFVLQEVEILQGPGDPAGAGGGVGGALNLRTAEPTLPIRGLLEVEGDSRGGQFSDFAYDGTLPGGKFAFATMASVDGSPGPLNRMDLAVPVAGGNVCCLGVPSDALRKSLLMKLRMTPNPSLTVTASFLGVNLQRALAAEDGVFLADGSYGGLVPSVDATQYQSLRFVQAQARLDRGSDGFDAHVYGLDLASSMQSGATGIVSSGNDGERGFGLQWRHQTERDVYGVSLDQSNGTAANNNLYGYPVAGGSSVTSVRLRGTAALHPSVADEIDLAAEAVTLSQWAAPSGGRFASYSWNPNAARIAVSHVLRPDLSLRAAYGVSGVTPPLAVLSGAAPALQTYVGFPARTVAFSSDVDQIERAVGGNVGLEWRLHGSTTTLSADWYASATHNVYALESESLGPAAELMRWFNGPAMLDQGVQFSLVQFKRVGLGFIAQAAFPRTYVVGALPPGFYAKGNLAVVPGQNIGGGAFFVPGENDVAPLRIPYAQGYGEISYKWPRGSRLSLGALYVGSNNPYSQPAFTTFNSNLELSLGAKAKLQLSVENLFDVLDNRLPLAFTGIGVPLANGGIGLTNAGALVPRTIRFMIRQSFGGNSLLER